jgi:hypothetical protein
MNDKELKNLQKDKSRTIPDADPCVRCGYCCNKIICNHGEDDGYGKCRFLELVDEDLMIFSCNKRDIIMEMEKGSNIPMFDNYCSSSLMNTTREAVIKKILGNK